MARFFFALVAAAYMMCWGLESKLLAAESQDDFGIAADNSKKDAKADSVKAKDAEEEDVDSEESGDKDEADEAKPAAKPAEAAKTAAVKKKGDDAEEGEAEEEAGDEETAEEAKPKAEAKPATPVVAKPAVEAKPAAPVEVKPAVPVEVKPAVAVEVKPAAPVEVKPAVEAKPAAPVEVKPAVAAEAKPAAPVEVKPAVAAEAKPAACPAQSVCPLSCCSDTKCCPLRYAALYLPNRLMDLGRIFSLKAGFGPVSNLDLYLTRYGRLGGGYGQEYFLDKGWAQSGGGYSEGWFTALGPWAAEKRELSHTFGGVKPYSIIEAEDVELPYATGVCDPWAFGVGAGWFVDFDFKMHPDKTAYFFAGFAGYDLGGDDFK